MDTLTVKGVGSFDGDYDCDIVGLMSLTSDEAMTMAEAHLVKRLAGVRGNEIPEAYMAGDTDVRMALAIIVLARHGKTLDEHVLAAKPTSAIAFAFGDDVVVEHPTTDEGTETSASPQTGGSSSPLTLAPQVTDRDVIGVPA